MSGLIWFDLIRLEILFNLFNVGMPLAVKAVYLSKYPQM